MVTGPMRMKSLTEQQHPLPRFEDESASQALSLRLQNNTLYLYDETEGQSKPM